jgi:geranylgeranylglycerol-phosphate geranylgeranyltransferase
VPGALRLVRAGNLGVSFIGTIVGGLAGRGTGVLAPVGFWIDVLLAAISTACVTGAGNVLNDILDREGDRTNHPDRPLVTGAISVRAAKALAVGLFVVGVAIVVPVIVTVPLLGAILAVAVAALLGYEFLLKARGFVGNGVVALLTGLVFLYGGAVGGHVVLLLPLAAMAFLATLSREVIKDMEDVAGDVGRTTLPKTHGIPFATGTARAAVGAAIALSVVPLLWYLSLGSVAGIMYAGLVVAADAVFGVSVVYLPARLHYEQSMSKVAMTVALFAFLAVAFR